MDEVIVNTDCGLIRGLIEKSFEDYSYCSFKGVPYAKPSIGELRFQDPQPPNSWKGIKNATSYGSPCAQYHLWLQKYVGSDNCLYLNVYVKSIKTAKPLPVMMYIHGGLFNFGCGDDLLSGPDYLLKKDIVLVTINYRLGILGFLNLEHEVAPGNLGLKDQVMALRWVKRNIVNFGGDPNNVTIFGESSGAACVNYLCFSPLAKGLFHKAISQSGVALNPWSFRKNSRSHAQKLCKLLGKEIYNPTEIIAFLKTFDSLELVKMTRKILTQEEVFQGIYPFVPGIDYKSSNPFLSIPLSEALEKGINVPYLLGYNNCEGILTVPKLEKLGLKVINDNFEIFFSPYSKEMLQKYKLKPEDLKALCNEKLNEDNYLEQAVALFTSTYFLEEIHRIIHQQIQHNKVPLYFYKFIYDEGISFSKLAYNISFNGASHLDELPYLFSMRIYDVYGIKPLQKGTISYKLMEQMTEMWTNFAKYGEPTPVTNQLLPEKWLPASDSLTIPYMSIGSNLSMNKMLSVINALHQIHKFKSKL